MHAYISLSFYLLISFKIRYFENLKNGIVWVSYGRDTAVVAIRILKAADHLKPIKISTELCNEMAQRLYLSLGFQRLPELDGDDIVFGL